MKNSLDGESFSHFPKVVADTIGYESFRPPSSEFQARLLEKTNSLKTRSFDYLGRVFHRSPKSSVPVEPRLSPLISTYLHESFPHLLEGEVLRDNEYWMAAGNAPSEYQSMSRYSSPNRSFSRVPYELAERMLSDAFSSIGNVPMLDLDSSFYWLEKQSSPGYPWKNLYQTKALLLASDFFRSWYVWWERKIFSGFCFLVFWRAFIKREWKKLSKLLALDPRTILACPIEFNLLGNRLFGAQNSEISVLGRLGEVPLWAGATKFNAGWNNLAARLDSFPNMNDSDVVHFDGSVRVRVFKTIRNLRLSWAQRSPGYTRAVFYYYSQVIFTTIVGWYGDLYRKKKGQPSGQVNTLHDNSLIHLLYWFYFWCAYVVPYLHDLSPTWVSFKEHVCLVVQGDDAIYSYSDYVKKFFHHDYLVKSFSDFLVNVKVTHRNPVHSVLGLEFCSTGFTRYKSMFFPIPKKKKMLATIVYVKHSLSSPAARNPRIFLRRLMSIRIDVFWEKELFDLCESLIEYVLENFSASLAQTPSYSEGDDSTLQQILDLRIGRLTIMRMYSARM